MSLPSRRAATPVTGGLFRSCFSWVASDPYFPYLISNSPIRALKKSSWHFGPIEVERRRFGPPPRLRNIIIFQQFIRVYPSYRDVHQPSAVRWGTCGGTRMVQRSPRRIGSGAFIIGNNRNGDGVLPKCSCRPAPTLPRFIRPPLLQTLDSMSYWVRSRGERQSSQFFNHCEDDETGWRTGQAGDRDNPT